MAVTNIQVAHCGLITKNETLKEKGSKGGRKENLQLEGSKNGNGEIGVWAGRGQLTSSLAWNKYSFPSCKLLGEREASGQS